MIFNKYGRIYHITYLQLFISKDLKTSLLQTGLEFLFLVDNYYLQSFVITPSTTRHLVFLRYIICCVFKLQTGNKTDLLLTKYKKALALPTCICNNDRILQDLKL